MPTVLRESFELRCADVDFRELRFQRDYLLRLPSGETFKRRIDFEDDQDYADQFWDHAERVEAISPEAALVDRCLAVERLFPESRELLPA